MHLEVVLLVMAPNLRVKGDSRFLLLAGGGQQPRLPFCYVSEKKECQDVAAELLLEYAGLRALINDQGWIPLKQVGVFDKLDRESSARGRAVAIGYGAIIPETTHLPFLKKGMMQPTWFTCGQINEHKPLYADHLEILSVIAMNL